MDAPHLTPNELSKIVSKEGFETKFHASKYAQSKSIRSMDERLEALQLAVERYHKLLSESE